MMKKIRCLLFISVLIFSACTKPEVKTGYVKVPTVTEHALSGVYTLLGPTSPTVKLYYEECGHGEPLILLHEQAVDCRMWDAVFFKLAKNFRVIRYDLRGYGKSDNPESGYGYLHVDDLKSFMDGLGIKKAHFAGLSMGGMVLSEFLAMYPECVLTATITSGALGEYPNRLVMPKNILKVYNDTVYTLKLEEAEKIKMRGLEAEKNDWKTMMRSISGKHYRDISKNLNKMIDEWKGWQLLNAETDPFIGIEADSLLTRQKKKPRILLLIGQYDAIANKKSMQHMAVRCPDAKIQLMFEAGHFTCMESPDEFVEKILAFIQKK
jgi:serine-type D-Ala-D-Ala carboxypeptidase